MAALKAQAAEGGGAARAGDLAEAQRLLCEAQERVLRRDEKVPPPPPY